MGIHLITGYAGKEHITSDDQASFNESVFGSGSYVFNKGNRLKAVMKSNTAIDVYDGDIIHNGRHIRVTDINTVYFDEVTAADKSRVDLVVVRYEKDEVTGIENAVFKVIKGTEYKTAIAPPTHDPDNEVLLYTVQFTGFSMTGIATRFSIIMSNKDFMENLRFALSAREIDMKESDWETERVVQNGIPVYVYKASYEFSLENENFIDAECPLYFLKNNAASSLQSELQFSLIDSLDVEKTETGFIYTFHAKAKVGGITVIVKGV